ncbi:MAG: ceramidase domain-containing protein [Hyphomicrobiaceae bacterium]
MSAKIFAYCERGLDPAFWAEPLNAITNGAFIIAALMATWRWQNAPPARRGWVELYLIVLIYAIGIGSFLFHTFATLWAAFADTLPIGIFMVSYLAYALRRYLNLGWLLTVVALIFFFISLRQASVFRCGSEACLNGSFAYVPAFIALVLIGAILVARRHAAGWSLVLAGMIFAVSLTFRTLDQDLCGYTIIPPARAIGLHFLWHILNAVLLYVLARAAILYGQPAKAGGSEKRI